MKNPNILIIGCSCAGKSTLAVELARKLGLRHIELDGIYWRANWTPCPLDQYVARVDQATSGEGWIVDGNFKASEEIVWSRCDVVIWLNLGYSRIVWRAFHRTLARLISGERVHGGNRERWRNVFYPDWIPWWVMRNFWRRRRELRNQIERWQTTIQLIEIRRPAQLTQLKACVGRLANNRNRHAPA